MPDNLSRTHQQKYPIVRGGRYAIRPDVPVRRGPRPWVALPDPWLDREMRAVFASLCGPGTSAGIYKVAEGKQWPWRVFARRLREMLATGHGEEQMMRAANVWPKYVHWLCSSDTDRAA